MSFIGALNVYSKLIGKMHINLKAFYDLLLENTPWNWTYVHDQLFQKLQIGLTSETDQTYIN